MEAIKHQILLQNKLSNVYVPKSIRFKFSSYGVKTPYEKLQFIIEEKLLTYNYHRLIDEQDILQIFDMVQKRLEKELTLPQESRFSDEFHQLLSYVAQFLQNIADDKWFLYFKSFRPLVKLLEQCSNMKFIQTILEIFS